MSHAEKKVKWCLNKAQREISQGNKHRGLITTKPDKEKSRQHLEKAQHYLKATIKLYETGFSDISASTSFYATYHALLAILAKHGVESRNQECTFAFIIHLAESKKLNLDTSIIGELRLMQKTQEETIIGLREEYQYGTKLKMTHPQYTHALNIARKIIEETKEEMEKPN